MARPPWTGAPMQPHEPPLSAIEPLLSRETSLPKPSSAVGRARERLRSLVALLDDDSPEVIATVRGELARAGKRARPALVSAARGDSARLRARARALLAERDHERAVRRLLAHGSRGRIDLERALLVLARLCAPRFDGRPYLKTLDVLGAEARRRAESERDPRARALVLSNYLGGELGFAGSTDDYDHPDRVHLFRTLETKCGMPLTLAAVYLFVARRAGISAGILPIPGHVLLRVGTGELSYLFDPFHGGRPTSKADCARYLSEHNLTPRPEWFRDAKDALLFRRHVLNLMNSYQARGRTREARDLVRLAEVLGRSIERPRPTAGTK